MFKFTAYLLSSLIIIVNLGCANKCLVKSDPPGAHVSVEGEYRGDTPVVVEWKPSDGLFKRNIWVDVSKGGYVTETRKVHRGTKQLYFVLQPAAPDKTETSSPQQQEQQMQQQITGPTIVIGGQKVTGENAVEIREYGFVSFQSTPTGAEVYEGNLLIGTTPISKLRFQSGTHNITMKLKRYKAWVRQILVISNSEINIKADLEQF